MANRVIHLPETDIEKITSANIRAELARAQVTQIALAEYLGISQASVSAKLKGKTPWSLAEVGAVALALEVDPAELITPTRVKQNARRVTGVSSVHRLGLEPRTL